MENLTVKDFKNFRTEYKNDFKSLDGSERILPPFIQDCYYLIVNNKVFMIYTFYLADGLSFQYCRKVEKKNMKTMYMWLEQFSGIELDLVDNTTVSFDFLNEEHPSYEKFYKYVKRYSK